MMWCFFWSSTLYIIIHTHYCIAYYITSSYFPFIIEHKSSSTLTCCFLTAKISRDLSNYLQRYLWWWPQLKLYTYIIYTYNNHIYIYIYNNHIYIYTYTFFQGWHSELPGWSFRKTIGWAEWSQKVCSAFRKTQGVHPWDYQSVVQWSHPNMVCPANVSLALAVIIVLLSNPVSF